MKAKRPIALLMGFLMLITMTLSWLAPDSSVLAAEGTEVNTADDLDMIRSNPSGIMFLRRYPAGRRIHSYFKLFRYAWMARAIPSAAENCCR